MKTQEIVEKQDAGEVKRYKLKCFTIEDKWFNRLTRSGVIEEEPLAEMIDDEKALDFLFSFELSHNCIDRLPNDIAKEDIDLILAPVDETENMLFVRKRDKGKVLELGAKEFAKQKVLDGLHPIAIPIHRR
jgi:hypothetical protein